MALSYLPDDPLTHVTQVYLYTIINTLDSEFFVLAEAEVERIAPKLKAKPPQEVLVDPQMLALIESFTQMRISSTRTSSIGGIAKPQRKRTRAQVSREWELMTKMREVADRKAQHRDRLAQSFTGAKRGL